MPDQELISKLRAEGYPVATTCRSLDIPRSTYYRKGKQPGMVSNPDRFAAAFSNL